MGTHPIFESDFDCLTDGHGPGVLGELAWWWCLSVQQLETYFHPKEPTLTPRYKTTRIEEEVEEWTNQMNSVMNKMISERNLKWRKLCVAYNKKQKYPSRPMISNKRQSISII